MLLHAWQARAYVDGAAGGNAELLHSITSMTLSCSLKSLAQQVV